MPSLRLQVNRASIEKKINDCLGNDKVRTIAYRKASSIFKRAKFAMMREFSNHPVVVELKMGPRGLNLTNTLDGYGNLFAFIGFREDNHPTAELEKLLNSSTQLRMGGYRNKIYYFKGYVPSKAEIEAVTPMPWESGNSWATGIETHISGLSHFLFKKWNRSRSGMGLQLPDDIENLEGATFTPMSFMTEILDNFRERINYNK